MSYKNLTILSKVVLSGILLDSAFAVGYHFKPKS